MRQVIIGTPTYDGKVGATYAANLAETIKLGMSYGIAFSPLFIAYDALVQRARNDLFSMAYHGNVEAILWIDADMSWNPEWAIQLVQTNLDVIGLPTPKKSLQEQYNIKVALEDLNPDEAGLLKVDAIGTGFLKMSRKAIEYLWDNSPTYMKSGVEHRWAFDVVVKDDDVYSEDTIVCEKLREGGFDIFVATTATTAHEGTMTFRGDFADYITRVKAAVELEAEQPEVVED